MFKTALLAATAAILISGIAPASAKTVQYTLADTVGTPLCDGLTLVEHWSGVVGTHTAGTICTEGDYAGGFPARKVLGSADVQWVITTTDVNNFPGYIEVFLLDQTAMTWQLYVESTQNSQNFELYDSGVLLEGDPASNGQVAQRQGGAKPRFSFQKQ
jgi:hypothetical protein